MSKQMNSHVAMNNIFLKIQRNKNETPDDSGK